MAVHETYDNVMYVSAYYLIFCFVFFLTNYIKPWHCHIHATIPNIIATAITIASTTAKPYSTAYICSIKLELNMRL